MTDTIAKRTEDCFLVVVRIDKDRIVNTIGPAPRWKVEAADTAVSRIIDRANYYTMTMTPDELIDWGKANPQ